MCQKYWILKIPSFTLQAQTIKLSGIKIFSRIIEENCNLKKKKTNPYRYKKHIEHQIKRSKETIKRMIRSIPLLDVCPKGSISFHRDLLSHAIAIATLFTTTRKWKPPNCPSTDRWIMKTKSLNLQINEQSQILNEETQFQEGKCCTFFLVCGCQL